MPESATSAPPKTPGTFASFLASFTGPAEKQNDDWDLSDLADDVATISYEDALRAHRPARASQYATEKLPENSHARAAHASDHAIAGDKKGKTSSITLRLTEAEHAQLRERAAAAKLSISAYIRSCIFEAESLRAQVREALSRMQTASMTAAVASADRPIRNWHTRLFPRWSRHHKADG